MRAYSSLRQLEEKGICVDEYLQALGQETKYSCILHF